MNYFKEIKSLLKKINESKTLLYVELMLFKLTNRRKIEQFSPGSKKLKVNVSSSLIFYMFTFFTDPIEIFKYYNSVSRIA